MDTERRKAIMATASIAAGAALFSGCTTNIGATSSPEQKKAEIDKGADATLAMLYSTVPGSQELARKARGILVFPKIYAAAFGLGGEYGEGALRIGGRTVDYYSTAGASYGFQAGAQSKALVMMFMTQQALDKFRASEGWTAGADASVVVMKTGAQGTVDTTSVSADVHAFPLTNAGLMAGVSIDGNKVSKLKF